MSVQTANFFTMDTLAESTVITKEADAGKEANTKIEEICKEVEGRISNTIEGSEVWLLNNRGSLIDTYSQNLSNETANLLILAKQMKEQTNGAFNPNLGELINLWGINNQDDNFVPKLPEKTDFYPAVEQLQNYDYEIKQNGDGYIFYSPVNPGPKIDLGAIGKGYATDKISDYLIEAGIPNALVSLGGSSILAAGKNKIDNLWTVALKDPLHPDDVDKVCGYISATDKYISVSGGYERFITINGVDYCHIIDPETGYPVDNDLLCTVVIMNAPSALQTKENNEKLKNNGAIADALSTALYVMGKDKALKFYNTTSLDFEMILFVKSDNPRGYEIIPTNVMFTEFEQTTQNERLTPKFD